MEGMISWAEFKESISNRERDFERIKRAFYYGEEMHNGQKRKFSKLPYFIHPIHVALNLKKEDDEMIISGLLHDVIEDTDQTAEDIEEKFGYRVSQLVKGVSKSNEIPMFDALNSVIDEFPEVIMLRIADRIHNMRDKFSQMPERTKLRYRKETPKMLEICNKLQNEGKVEAQYLIEQLERLHNHHS